MRSLQLSKLSSVCALFLLLSAPSFAAVPTKEAAKMLPQRIANFRANNSAVPPPLRFLEHTQHTPEDFDIVAASSSAYLSDDGQKLAVDVIQTRSDSSAYALLSKFLSNDQSQRVSDIGTVGIVTGKQAVAFYKGATYVFVYSGSGEEINDESLINFARAFAETLDEGTGEIPVLVKHLPDWETAQERAVYAVTLPALKEIVPNQSVLDAVSFEAGTEAVTATYDQARLVVVEYATPQLAFDGDAAIRTRIAQLRGEGQPVPSGYRRVGNYAVFVFDAPNEGEAAGLIDKVKYEKDVRWLGENPYAVERANRAWLNMSTSVIVNTVKATGLAIVICLGIGGIFGGMIFMRRRAQAALSQNYSDAGGMMRLNLDEMTQPNNAGRLIGQGDKERVKNNG